MKDTLLLFGIVALSLYWSTAANGQELHLQDLEAKVESLVPSAVNDTTPGLVIGVVHEGELIFSAGYGLANLAYGIPNDAQLVYNLGSVSKQFLGYAFAMLHAEGKLDLDDPVGKYLDDWPEFEHQVSLRHLLTHTSGYREAYTMSDLAGRPIGVDRLSRKECLDVVRKQPKLEFVPGARYTYNSTAWVILAEVLEQVTGQPAHRWVKTNVLVPLGMDNTYIESFVGEVIPKAAESYFYDRNLGYGNSKSNRAIFGASDVCASVEDLLHWLNNFRTKKIGGEKVMDLFLTPFMLNDGRSSGYGLGIQNGLHKGVRMYSHTGSHESFLTQIRYYPDHALGIVTISNFGGNGWIATGQIAEYVLKDFMNFPKQEEHPRVDLPVEKLEQFSGTYLSPSHNQTTNLRLVNDTLTIWGGTKLIPLSEKRFYSDTWGGQFEIVEQEDHLPKLIIHADAKSEYQQVASWFPAADELEVYRADYYSKELETAYHLVVEENQLRVRHRWLGEVRLNPVTRDVFQSDWGWFLEFERSASGDILGFNINSGRTLGVFFERK
ncbi:serine hydrolase [Lewinella sp. W8]|uniref:serine hydrolase domain-containing protein n=1 Tax=Lewinella sp. W8 TaxID=2528208 RepID=UPI0010673150|nr:serine hydrolase domain-containing protein [Lewinella sp. W8]MTB52103.1 serine hydrolase [Lewinella sp. W8]